MALTLHGSKHHYTIGDEVEIVVASANTRLRQIDFELFGVEKSHNFVTKKNQKVDKTSKKIKKDVRYYGERKAAKSSSRKTTKKSSSKKKKR